MTSSGRVGWLKFAPVLVLLGAAAPEPVSTWHVQRVTEGGAMKCRIESEKATINDGYQKVTVQIIITPTSVVQILSESPFDDGSGDIGVSVDKNAFVKFDKLAGDKVVVFETSAPTLIPQFKAGLRARAQLRFWPTWPVTGTHDVEFSLIGFTKAYEEMTGNCH